MRHAAQIKLKVCVLNHDENISNDIVTKSCTQTIDAADNWCLTEDRIVNKTQANRLRSKFKSFLVKVNGIVDDPANIMTELLSPDAADDNDADYTNRTINTEIDKTRELFEHCLAKACITHTSEAAKKRAAFQLYVEEMYKKHFFHHNYGVNFNRPQKMRCIYPTLSMVEHSCDPNCVIV